MKRIILADHHHLVREALTKMLHNEKDIYIVAEVGSETELLKLYSQLKPDLVLIDIDLPADNGAKAIRKIIEMNKDAKILFLAQSILDDYIYSILSLGGKGLVSKSAMKGELLLAIDAVLEGEIYFGEYDEEKLNKIRTRFKDNFLREIDSKFKMLTKREIEVLYHLGEGCTSIEIAEKLFISKRTVDFHRSNIMSKLKIKKSSELVIKAAEFHNQFDHQEKAM